MVWPTSVIIAYIPGRLIVVTGSRIPYYTKMYEKYFKYFLSLLWDMIIEGREGGLAVIVLYEKLVGLSGCPSPRNLLLLDGGGWCC